LLVIELRRPAGDDLAARPVVGVGHALDVARLLADEAVLEQRIDDRRGRTEPGEDEGLLLRLKLLPEEIVELRLLGGLLRQRGMLVRRQRAHHLEVFLGLEPRTVAHRRRDHGLQHTLHPRRVVAVHPAGQLEQVRRQRREFVQDAAQGLQFGQWYIGDRVLLQHQRQV